MGMFVVPTASEGYKEFTHKYLRRNKQDREVTDVYNQISDNEFLFVSSFDATNKVGYNFSLEHFEGTELKYKISARSIRWQPEDSTYRLTNYVKRTIGVNDDVLESKRRHDTIFHSVWMI